MCLDMYPIDYSFGLVTVLKVSKPIEPQWGTLKLPDIRPSEICLRY